jgi:ketosteroid isomerase-like protein
MRRTLLLGSVTLLSGLMVGMGSTRAQPAAEAEAIRAANAAFYDALSSRDIGVVERVWARDMQVFNIFAAGRAPLVGWSAVRGGYEELFKRFTEMSVTMPEPLIAQNGDSALVIGVETLRARLPNGDAANLSLPTTNVFVRRDGRWQMVHHHSSRPPQ